MQGNDGQSRILNIARATIGILVVFGFVGSVLLLLVLNASAGETSAMMPNVEDISSIYAGVTGVVLGYFFTIRGDPEALRANPSPEAERTRRHVSLILIAAFAVTILVAIAIVGLLMLYQQIDNVNNALPLVKIVGSIYSGVTGALVGHFFGR